MDEPTMAHPLDLLHGVGELWPVIAGKLAPQDLYNLSEAHPYWTSMLERRRPNFLMQLCLPLLTDLDLPDLLKLRLVNKGWKRGVDHYLQHQIYEEKPFINEKEPTRTEFHLSRMYSNNWILDRKEVLHVNPVSHFFPLNPVSGRHRPRQISAWLDSIEQNPSPSANPILSREALFFVTGREETDESQKETTDIITRSLRAHGRHLLRCSFRLHLELHGARSFEREYSHLREWLNLVPNLISLDVSFCRRELIPDEAELATHIRDNPLPELPNLSKLTVKSLPPPLLQALLQKYNQVQTLELSIAGLGEYRFDPVHMGTLKTLKVDIWGTDGLATLEQLRTESWLASLHTLEMALGDFGRLVTLGVLIDFLNSNFGAAGRLVKVGLRIPTFEPRNREGCMRLFKDSQACRLRLPHVEQFKLVVSNSLLLDFLLPMRQTLEKLAVSNNRSNFEEECQQLIQYNGWMGRGLLYSNIWKALPKLNFVRVLYADYPRAPTLTYRRREGGAPILCYPRGKELSYEENLDWEEAANGNGDADADDR